MTVSRADHGAAEPGSTATAEAGSPVAVQAVRLAKGFPGVRALDGVSLDLRPGEIHALAGENGSGKSTLAKIIYGRYIPDTGHLELNGRPVVLGSLKRAAEHGIAAVTQELTLAPTLSVAENIAMGRLTGPRLRMVNWRRVRREVRKLLDELSVDVDERTTVAELSIELQQEVEIARALFRRPSVLVVDEATSALSEMAAARLLSRLRELRDAGVAVLFISHRMRELYQCADTVTVLRDGQHICTKPMADTQENELVRLMVGRELPELFGKRRTSTSSVVSLEASGLTTVDGAVRDVSFTVRQGEIIGVAGLPGCGKAELGLAIAGAVHSGGDVHVGGQRVILRNPRAAIRAGIAFLPDDRQRAALFPTLSIQRNLSVAWHSRLTRGGLVKRGLEDAWTGETLRRFHVRMTGPGAPVTGLSGGNQQKVVLARCVSMDPAVVVLAEPTRGIDVGAKAEIYQIMHDLAEAGKSIIVISSELPELLGVCERILVMRRGRISAEFGYAEASEEAITHAAMGGRDGDG